MFIKVKSLTEKADGRDLPDGRSVPFPDSKDMGKDSVLIEAIITETKNDSILKVFKKTRYTKY